MGAIIKPMEWRRHNDSKLFTRDWSNFIRPLKIRRRILMAYRQALVERDKNLARKWWFLLSKYERDCWFGIREEGQISNIYIASMDKWKGPKRQRGNFAMFPAGIMAAGNFALALDSANNAAINIDFSPGGPLRAGFYIRDDGTFDRVNSSGTNQINTSTDWVRPNFANIGDDYEAIWNKLSGGASAPNDETFTEDVWTTLTVDESVTDNRSTTSVPHGYEFDIGDDGASTSDVNQDYTAEAGDII
jgi:hypothetical protein